MKKRIRRIIALGLSAALLTSSSAVILAEDVMEIDDIAGNLASVPGLGTDCTAASLITVPILGTITVEEFIKRVDPVYMPTGNQYITYSQETCLGYSEAPKRNHIQAINVNKVGAGNEKLTVAYNKQSKYDDNDVNPTMLFFVRG